MLDNECYATTGGQPVPNAKNVDYAAIARGCGYPAAHAFTDIADLTAAVPDILAKPGPVFCAMKRSEEHTSELQSLMRISYAVFCLKKKKRKIYNKYHRKYNKK